MAHRGFKLKVTGPGQYTVGLTSILNQGQFSSFPQWLAGKSVSEMIGFVSSGTLKPQPSQSRLVYCRAGGAV